MIGLQEWFVRPLRGGRRIGVDTVQSRKDMPNEVGANGKAFLDILHRLMHQLSLSTALEIVAIAGPWVLLLHPIPQPDPSLTNLM